MNVDEMFERLNPTLFEKSSFIPNMWDRYVRGQAHLSSHVTATGKPDVFKFSFVLISCLFFLAIKPKDILITFKAMRVIKSQLLCLLHNIKTNTTIQIF
jgi:hypothetical protein